MSDRLRGINDWFTVLTNVGVIVGLMLLVVEVRQANTAMEREFRAYQQDVLDSVRETWQNFGMVLASDQDVAEIWVKGGRGDTLNEVERERYYRLATEFIYMEQQSYLNSRRFSDDSDAGDWVIRQVADYVNRYPGLSEYLRGEMRHLNPEFVERIDDLSALNPKAP
jgi:hypothetical protein